MFPRLREVEDGGPVDEELTNELEALVWEHASAGELLERLRELTDGFDASTGLCNTHRAAIDGLGELERDRTSTSTRRTTSSSRGCSPAPREDERRRM